MRKVLKKFSATLLVVAMLMSMLPVTAAAADATYDVGTAEEYAAAVTAIRAAGAGEYVINLTADINNASGATFNYDDMVVTYKGNGHSLNMKSGNSINVSAKATVNLGGDGSELTITKATDNDMPGILCISGGSSVVNMYDGAHLKDHRGNNYFGGGVTINSSTFNMYGGSIENCGINGGGVCFGGGVSVDAGGLFNMYGGSIKDCYTTTSLPSSNKGLIPWGAGGGVIVTGGSTFNMSGGTISGCSTTESGGGVAVIASKDSYFAHSALGYLDSRFNMTGGTISGNEAAYYGGGVFVSGLYINANPLAAPAHKAGTPANPGVSISGAAVVDNTADAGGGILEVAVAPSIANSVGAGTKLCNNIATEEGSDVYLLAVNGVNTKLSLVDAATMSSENYKNTQPSDATGHAIGAWYEDYDGDRYTDRAPADREATKVEVSAALQATSTDAVCLIAAPAATEKHTVTFDAKNTNATDPDDQEVEDGAQATKPEDPTDSTHEKVFVGWFTDAECTVPYDFTAPVTEDIDLFGKWENGWKVSFINPNGGVTEDAAAWPDTMAVRDGVPALKPAVPTAPDYVFVEWCTDGTCSTPYDFSTPVTEDVILYAKWNTAVYVTFDVNNTEVAAVNMPDMQKIGSGDEAVRPAKPSATNEYTFLNWYKDPECTVKFDFTAPVLTNTTVYAKWTPNDDLNAITLLKKYVWKDGYTGAGTEFADTTGILKETIAYQIEPLTSFNREYGKTEIPDIEAVDISVGIGDDSAIVVMPDFSASEYGMGDYWYKITETVGTTTGVTYAADPYYLHIQVNNQYKVGLYFLHTSAPNADGTFAADDTKTDITNEYGYGSLSITKKVTGDQGDVNKPFNVTVTFTAPAGTVVGSDITYNGGKIDAGWSDTTSVTIAIKNGETVTFTNIPDGVTYSVKEADYSAEGYTTSYSYDAADAEDAADAAGAVGGITDDLDAVTITNTKTTTPDVGVKLEDVPFLMLLLGAGAFAALLAMKKRRTYFAD